MAIKKLGLSKPRFTAMGIPGLFSYITRNFPSVTDSIRKSAIRAGRCEYLYLDTNALIHPCAQLIFNYGQNKRMLDPHAKLSYEAKMDKFLECVISTLEKLIGVFGPTKGVMLAVDGCAPFAKQTQQRQRRYTAARDRSKGEFDSNMISPGTAFMFDLHLAIRRLCARLEKTGRRVFYSSYMTPGEGEHKLLDVIRKKCKTDDIFRESDRHVIVGPDGDLLVLGLCLPVAHLTIAREDMRDANLWHFVNVGLLKSALTQDRDVPPSFLENFVLVCSVLGNDFLPRIQMFVCLSQGLEYILGIWRNLMNTKGKYTPINIRVDSPQDCLGFDLLQHFGSHPQPHPPHLQPPYFEPSHSPLPTPKPTYHVHTGEDEPRNMAARSEILSCLFEQLAAVECDYLLNQGSEQSEDPVFYNHTLMKNINQGLGLDFLNYRKDYYAKAGANTEQEIGEMCRDYIKTLVWIHNYYINGIGSASWTWRYPHFYPPLMVDLCSHSRKGCIESFMPGVDVQGQKLFLDSQPIPPFLQLLLVLPPSSGQLLPVGYRKLMVGSDFPTEFQVDGEGKKYEHEMIVKLKLPNVSKLEKKYRSVTARVPQFPRNSLIVDQEF
jgi:5'-3' exoribonuclease 1